MRHQQAPRFLISTIDVRIGGVFTAAGSSGPDHFLVNTQTGAHSHFPHNTRGWAETEPQHCIHGLLSAHGDLGQVTYVLGRSSWGLVLGDAIP